MQKGWVVNRAKWVECLQEIGGLNWKRIKLVSQRRNNIPKKPGIYLICSDLPGVEGVDLSPEFQKLYNTVYIGMSKNLQSRFSQYLGAGDKKLLPSIETFGELDFLHVVIEESEKELKRIETLLIDTLGPTVNKIRSVKVGDEVTGVIGEGISVSGRIDR